MKILAAGRVRSYRESLSSFWYCDSKIKDLNIQGDSCSPSRFCCSVCLESAESIRLKEPMPITISVQIRHISCLIKIIIKMLARHHRRTVIILNYSVFTLI
jgi:hypothetical protein